MSPVAILSGRHSFDVARGIEAAVPVAAQGFADGHIDVVEMLFAARAESGHAAAAPPSRVNGIRP